MENFDSTNQLLEYVQSTSNLQRIKFEETIALISTQLAEKQEELIKKEAYILELEDTLFSLNEENERLNKNILENEEKYKENLNNELLKLKNSYEEKISNIQQVNENNIKNYNKIILMEKLKNKKKILTLETSYDLICSRFNEQIEYIKELENIITTTFTSVSDSSESGPASSALAEALIEQDSSLDIDKFEKASIAPPLPPSSTSSTTSQVEQKEIFYPPLPPVSPQAQKKNKIKQKEEKEEMEEENIENLSSIPKVTTSLSNKSEDEEFPSPLAIVISRNIRRTFTKNAEKSFQNKGGLLQQFPEKSQQKHKTNGQYKELNTDEIAEILLVETLEQEEVKEADKNIEDIEEDKSRENKDEGEKHTEIKRISNIPLPPPSIPPPVNPSRLTSSTVLSNISSKKHLSDKIPSLKPEDKYERNSLNVQEKGQYQEKGQFQEKTQYNDSSLQIDNLSSLLDISIDSVRPFDNDSIISDSDLANIVKEIELSDYNNNERAPSPYSREVQSDSEAEGNSYLSYSKVYKDNRDSFKYRDANNISMESEINYSHRRRERRDDQDSSLVVASLDEDEESFDVSTDFTPMVNWIKSSQNNQQKKTSEKYSPISNKYFNAFEDNE